MVPLRLQLPLLLNRTEAILFRWRARPAPGAPPCDECGLAGYAGPTPSLWQYCLFEQPWRTRRNGTHPPSPMFSRVRRSSKTYA